MPGTYRREILSLGSSSVGIYKCIAVHCLLSLFLITIFHTTLSDKKGKKGDIFQLLII